MTETIINGKLPIRTKNLRFIEWRENLAPNEPLDLTRKTPICIFIAAQLRLGLSLMEWPRKNPEMPHCEVVETYEDSLPFTLSGKLSHYHIFHLLDQIARSLDGYIPSIMHEEVLARVTVAHHIGISEKLVIEKFLEETDLFEKTEFDALKKRQQRFRSARNFQAYTHMRGKHRVTFPD